jgi:hypothetical protein
MRENGFGARQNAEPKETVCIVDLRRRRYSHAAIVRRFLVNTRNLHGWSVARDRTEKSDMH